MKVILKSGLGAWRKIAGENTSFERFLKRQYYTVKSRIEKKYIGPNFIVFWSGAKKKRRICIYLKGSCDLLSIFSCPPLIHNVLDGTCCILREGAVWDSRSDFILQAMKNVPQELVAPIIERLKLPENYFKESQLMNSSISVPLVTGAEEFPKNLVIMSIGADVVRTLYQHREHGFLIDPGGWWFNQSVTKVLSDLSTAAWFREDFVNIGRISVETFTENLTQIIRSIKANSNAHILVFNILTVEPGNLTHNYQFVKNSLVMRAREFNLALAELSRKLDFSILDVDRILKMEGVKDQIDYAHFPPEFYPSIASEAVRIMKKIGLF